LPAARGELAWGGSLPGWARQGRLPAARVATSGPAPAELSSSC